MNDNQKELIKRARDRIFPNDIISDEEILRLLKGSFFEASVNLDVTYKHAGYAMKDFSNAISNLTESLARLGGLYDD